MALRSMVAAGFRDLKESETCFMMLTRKSA